MHSSNVSWSCFAALMCTMAGCSPSEEPQAESEEQAGAVATEHLPSAWVPPDPPWLQKLEEAARGELNKANEWLKGAHWQWDQGNLTGAKQELDRAYEVYSRLLGEDHWKTWDCRFDLSLLDVQLKHGEEPGIKQLGHLHNIAHLVEYSPDAQGRDPDQQEEYVETACSRIAQRISDPYKKVLDYYRLHGVGLAKYEQWKQSNASLLEHAYNHLKDAAAASDVFPKGHFLRADVHYHLAQILTSKSEAVGSAEATEEITSCLTTAFDVLGTSVREQSRWTRTLELIEAHARNLGRYTEARMALDLRFATSRTETEETATRRIMYQLASATLYNLTHDNGRARELLSEALKLLDDLSDVDRKTIAQEGLAARLHEELAIAYTGLRQYEIAFDHYTSALQEYSCRGPRSPRTAEDSEHDECWRAHYFYAAARSRHALRLLSESGKKNQQDNRSWQFLEQADLHFGLACTAHESAPYHPLFRLMQLRAHMGGILAEGNVAEEIPSILDKLKKLQPKQSVSKASKCRLIAYAHAWLNQNEDAKEWCDQAADWYQKAREKGGIQPITFALWHENESPYLLAAIVEKRLDHDREALARLEQHAAQGLREMLAPTPSEPPQPGSLWAQLTELDSIRRGAKATVELMLNRAVPRTDRTGPDVFTSCQVDDHTAIVGWLDDMPPAHMKPLPDSWVFVIKKSGQGTLWFPLKSDVRARTLPRQVRETARQRPGERNLEWSWLPIGHELFEQRLEPAWDYLEDVSQIYVLNRGLMLGVPVEMLSAVCAASIDTAMLVGDRHAVAYIPSCSVLEELSARQRPQHGPARLLTIYAPQLDCAKYEVEAVGAHFTNRPPLAADGNTERELRVLSQSGKLAEYEFVLFSMHAHSHLFDLGSCFLELEKGLSPAVGRTKDGRLDFWEISGLDLPARLVVLSGCETGLGRPLESEGFLGLPHAFFNAGARGAVVSLWRIPDSPSNAVLMERFFDHMVQRGHPEGKALAEAKRDLRRMSRGELGEWCVAHTAEPCCKFAPRGDLDDRPYEDPYYWASFVLVGPHD